MSLGERAQVKVVFGVDARWNVDVELQRLQEVPLQLVTRHTQRQGERCRDSACLPVNNQRHLQTVVITRHVLTNMVTQHTSPHAHYKALVITSLSNARTLLHYTRLTALFLGLPR